VRMRKREGWRERENDGGRKRQMDRGGGGGVRRTVRKEGDSWRELNRDRADSHAQESYKTLTPWHREK